MAPRRFDLVVLDLDGTIAETRYAIAHALNRALADLGRDALDVDTVLGFVGDGAPLLVARALAVGGREASAVEREAVLQSFVTAYDDAPLYRTELYPGVRETIEALRRHSVPCAVLTNKPGALARRVVGELGATELFETVLGGGDVPAKKPDPAALLELCARWDVEPSRALMVGDSAVDIDTARAAGTAAVGVLWGFRPDHFDAHPPDYRLTSFAELLDEL